MKNSSHDLFLRACQSIPGGVNSPVRAFKGVGGDPVFIDHAQGAYLWDQDGNRYIDYVGSWGPMVLGHSYPAVIAAVKAAVDKGLSFGAPTLAEIEMAERVCSLVASIEKVRMVNSGTEATMSAIRLARGYTGRDTIVKFEGCYHGHADSLLIKAGSGALTLGVPTSPGVPKDLAKHTVTLEYNNLDQVKTAFSEIGNNVACIIVEPVAGNMNCVPATQDFLEGLRSVCGQFKTVLIFDEVMTGFRVALGGAQSLYKVNPDLTTLGKVIGGGMPVGAFGGRAEIMNQIAPDGPVYQAGTLSGNPVAMAAGLATLTAISEKDFFPALTEKTARLATGLKERADKAGVPVFTQAVGGMFGLFFTESKDIGDISRFSQVMACNTERFKQFFHLMLESGVYLAPSAFETGFVSAAHTDKDITATLDAAEQAFKKLS